MEAPYFLNVVKNRKLFGVEGLGALWISIAVLVLETKILFIDNTLYVYSLQQLIENTKYLAIYVTYGLSVVFVPLLIALAPSILRELTFIHRTVAERAASVVKLSSLRSRLSVVIVSIPIASLSLFYGMIHDSVPIMLISCVPVFVLLAILLEPFIRVSEHRKAIEMELPWFAILLEIVESIGAGVGFLIERLRSSRLLKAVARELDVIDRDSKLYYLSQIDAFLSRASRTPSARFARFLAGYATRLRAGINVVSWLREWIREELMRSELVHRIFSDRASMVIAQLAIGVYTFIPLVMASLGELTPLTTVLIPVLGTPALIVMAYALRPKSLDTVSIKRCLLSLALLAFLSLALYRALGPYSVVLGWVAAILLSLPVYRQLRECEVLSRESYDILRDLIEYCRMGISITSALREIAKSSALSSITRSRLQEVLKLVDMGVPLTQTVKYVRTPSFTFKFTIFALGLMYESGVVSPETIHRLIETMKRIEMSLEGVKKLATMFDMFALANVGIVVWIYKTFKAFTPLQVPQYVAVSVGTLPGSALAIMLAISMLGYAIISTVLRRGYIAFEPRHAIFATISLLAMPFLC